MGMGTILGLEFISKTEIKMIKKAPTPPAVIKIFSFKKFYKYNHFRLTTSFLFAIIYPQDVSLVVEFHILPLRRIQLSEVSQYQIRARRIEYQIFLKGRNRYQSYKSVIVRIAKRLVCPLSN